MATAPKSDSGTAAPGMSVAWMLRRNNRITMTTSAHDNSSVNSTSFTEARMVWVRSTMMSRWMPGGMSELIPFSADLMLSTVSITLAPGCLNTNSTTAM